MASVESRLGEISQSLAQIAQSAKLIAVTKKQDVQKIMAAYRAGQRDFGENYAQELVEHARWLREQGVEDARWHFIGRLQRNKINMLKPWIYSIHTVDRWDLAQELDKKWAENRSPLEIYLQVNIDQDPRKAGVSPSEVRILSEQINRLKHLRLRGLMCITASPVLPSVGTEREPNPFRRMRELKNELNPQWELSMGMSADYLVAAQEGANWVRVGSAIFGERSR